MLSKRNQMKIVNKEANAFDIGRMRLVDDKCFPTIRKCKRILFYMPNEFYINMLILELKFETIPFHLNVRILCRNKGIK